MSKQPEALRVADELEMWTFGEPAARLLREQHAEIQRLRAENELLRAENELLRDALRPIKL